MLLRPNFSRYFGQMGAVPLQKSIHSLTVAQDSCTLFQCMKNITLSAEDRLIAQARQRAQRERKTLNTVFREWLAAYVGKGGRAARYRDLTQRLKRVSSGRKFSRDELNER